MPIRQAMRWYGHVDPVSLADIRMAGATDIVSALHHIPKGQAWPVEEIRKHQAEIRNAGLEWTVVESIPVHEDIKSRTGRYQQYIENFGKTIVHLSRCGITTVCYNFMPLLDWTRTNLEYPYHDGSLALAFHWEDLALFDVFMLRRDNAIASYPQFTHDQLKARFNKLSSKEKNTLEYTILRGLPGSDQAFTLRDFARYYEKIHSMTQADLVNNLVDFHRAVVPVAEESGVSLAIHPDDPPYPLFGLPRVVSTKKDLEYIFDANNSPANGLTFCSGSLGLHPDNNLAQLMGQFSERIQFVHLRNVRRDEAGNFVESDHLDGDVNMPELIGILLRIMKDRNESIPVRPDHGHQMIDDLGKKDSNPGYTLIGRLRGLAEIRGVASALLHQNELT